MRIKDNPEAWAQYHRERNAVEYPKRRGKILAFLGGKCHKCGSEDNLLVVIKPGAPEDLRFDFTQWARAWDKLEAQLIHHQLECRSCKVYAAPLKEIKHGAYWAAYKRKCKCDDCEEYKMNLALERRENRRSKQ
jgi:hypothetical protein